MDKIGIIFGGRSGEHEISILSASSIIGAIDKKKYEVVPIGINKKGDWFLLKGNLENINNLDDERIDNLIPKEPVNTENAEYFNFAKFGELIDFAFPVLHGSYGEDGTIQGLFEMISVPYAGCGVACSAISMDKIFTKEVWLRENLPVCKHQVVLAHEFIKNKESEINRVDENLSYPMFVKPANMGSSVGVSKVYNKKELEKGIKFASNFDSRILIEENVVGREVEVGMLGNEDSEVSVIGEITTSSDFYDYDSKYKDNCTKLTIPADLEKDVADEIRALAKKAYKVLDGTGFSRIDFFYDKEGQVYLNEMNTIPGFTEYSMFPSLWKASGVPYTELIERIIKLGYERYNAKNSRKAK